MAMPSDSYPSHLFVWSEFFPPCAEGRAAGQQGEALSGGGEKSCLRRRVHRLRPTSTAAAVLRSEFAMMTVFACWTGADQLLISYRQLRPEVLLDACRMSVSHDEMFSLLIKMRLPPVSLKSNHLLAAAVLFLPPNRRLGEATSRGRDSGVLHMRVQLRAAVKTSIPSLWVVMGMRNRLRHRRLRKLVMSTSLA